MKVRSIACRNGVVLLCALALMSCSSAVLDDASGEPAGTVESAHEPGTQEAGPAHPSAPAPPVAAPGAPVAQSEPEGTPPSTLEEGSLPAHSPTVTVVEATKTFDRYDRVNNRNIQESRKVFRFVRTGDDSTLPLVIQFSNRYGGTYSTITSGFAPGRDTADYPARGVAAGVTMTVALNGSRELQPYIDLAGLGPRHGFRPYVLGEPKSLTITGT